MFVGVDLFYVLSGFLITGILFDSLESPHYFRNFYVRRALRIFPIFYGFFLLLFLATPLFRLHWHWNLLTYFFYFGNIYTPLADLAKGNPTTVDYVWHGVSHPIVNIGHLWSLCVEEQFYLIWPALIWWIRGRRKLMNFCIVVCVLTLLLRIALAAIHPVENTQYLLLWSTYTAMGHSAVWGVHRAMASGDGAYPSTATAYRHRNSAAWIGGAAGTAPIQRNRRGQRKRSDADVGFNGDRGDVLRDPAA